MNAVTNKVITILGGMATLGELLQSAQKKELFQSRRDLHQIGENRAIEDFLRHHRYRKMLVHHVGNQIARIDVENKEIRRSFRKARSQEALRHQQSLRGTDS
jgi:protoheme ferro-lyase